MIKNERLKTAGQLVFLVIAMIFIVMITLGLEFDLTRLADARFWVECVCKLIVSLVVFNVVFEMDNTNRRMDIDSRYYAIKLKYRGYVDKLYDEGKYDNFATALEKRNESDRQQVYNHYLHKHGSSRLSMTDFKDIKEISEVTAICKAKLLDHKATKRVCKVMTKILNGDVKTEDIDPNEILLDKCGNKLNVDGIRFSTTKYKTVQNTSKAISYFISAIGLTIIQITSLYTGFFNALLTNAFLIASSMVSAMLNSKKFTALLTNKYEDITRFFQKDVFSEKEE